MGVQHLWDILQDVKVPMMLGDLKDQRLAVDLATWICEADSIARMQAISKPYLRNLYYRIKTLTKFGIQLIFVIDGKPPELKWETIGARQGTNFAGGQRNRLNAKFKQCCGLLDQLGIPWLKSDGEAEALCAYLNAASYVDACVTSDGDSFLYGAKMVYRKFSTDKQADSAVECYRMKDIEEKLGLYRRSLVALGLLLGCDYSNKGVPGVGKVHALELLKYWAKEDPLEKLKSLMREPRAACLDEKKPSHCSFCKHEGKKANHTKSCCPVCKEMCKKHLKSDKMCTCTWHSKEDERNVAAAEDRIREKAKIVQSFPDEAVIKEFLRQRKLPSKSLDQKPPSLTGVVEYMVEKLEWSRETIFEKTLPIVTHWIMSEHECSEHMQISPRSIEKKRKREGVPVYEVIWDVSSFQDIADPVTMESQDVFAKRFPQLVAEYEKKFETKTKKKSKGSQSSKMTDFFAKKKQLSTKPTKSTEVTTDLVQSDLSATVSSTKANDDDVIYVGHESPTKRGKLSSTHEDASATVKKNLFAFQSDNGNDPVVADENFPDLSFGLNFSLGSSWMKTPTSSPQSSSVHDVKTLKIVNASPPPEPDSPKFLTLMERLKLKDH